MISASFCFSLSWSLLLEEALTMSYRQNTTARLSILVCFYLLTYARILLTCATIPAPPWSPFGWIHPIQQHCQLFRSHRHALIPGGCLRPAKSPLLQPLRAHPE